jgi:DNA processing protein
MKQYLNAFWHVTGMDSNKLRKIDKFFQGDFRFAWEKADGKDFIAMGLLPNFIADFFETRRRVEPEELFHQLEICGIELIERKSKEFPTLLKEVVDAPFLLYRLGEPLDAKQRHVAVVGTRKYTKYGQDVAEKIATVLANNHITVVSGLALGIDSIAHRKCVQLKKPTIAVLGSGLMNITPARHYQLAQQIRETGGTIISEYPGFSPAFKHRFVERNRIISGICEATVVVEAAEKSGSLITAGFAIDQNRQVFAVPGDISRSQSRGCNKIIQKGEASLVTSAEDLLLELGIESVQRAKNVHKNLSFEESLILKALSDGNRDFDELLLMSGMEIALFQLTLTRLELAGLIEKNDANEWQIA